MKKTFKQFLTESQDLPHWPKTIDELKSLYFSLCIDPDTGEVYMPPESKYSSLTDFNEDLSVSIRDDIQILPHMLVNGLMPFKIKSVDGTVNVMSQCKLKSLIGLPRKCGGISFENDAMDDNIHDFTNGPDEVEKFYTATMCDNIQSLNGLPKNLPNDIVLNFFCKNLKDFSALPREVDSLTIGKSEFFTEEDFKYLPAVSTQILLSSIPKLHTLRNIHKFVKKTERFGAFDVKVTSNILGLTQIKGLQDIDDCFHVSDDPLDPNDVWHIMQQFVPEGDMFECQDALNEAGYTEFAKL